MVRSALGPITSCGIASLRGINDHVVADATAASMVETGSPLPQRIATYKASPTHTAPMKYSTLQSTALAFREHSGGSGVYKKDGQDRLWIEQRTDQSKQML